MSDVPKELKYTKEHEWVRREGNNVVVGVTAHAQESLGDVVYVELPKVGSAVTEGKSFGVIESTKAVSELFSPLTGKVAKVNSALESAPDTVNQDPYNEGWILEIEPADPGAYDKLMSAEEYEKLTAAS
jgi:glycine cleavage system H protein